MGAARLDGAALHALKGAATTSEDEKAGWLAGATAGQRVFCHVRVTDRVGNAMVASSTEGPRLVDATCADFVCVE